MVRYHRLALVFGVLTPLLIWAGDVVLQHVFSAGDPIRASEVNANFEALRVATNTKADKQSTVTSGSRLKRLGYRFADGTTEVATFSQGISGFYDAQLDLHCFTMSTITDSAGKLRCLPIPVWTLMASAYSDATCTTPVQVATRVGTGSGFVTNSPGGLLAFGLEPLTPSDEAYVFSSGSSSALRIYAKGGAHTGSVYNSCASSPPCCPNPDTYFDVGAEVDPSKFVELTPARF